MFVNVTTGAEARVAGSDPISGNDLGVRYSGFRSLERFEDQIDGLNVGHISWPGGALAEADTDRFGLNYDGLMNPVLGQAGLSEMMAFANAHGTSLSVVLPTARYANDIGQLRTDMAEFMSDLLAGDYGPLPEGMFFHIGAEHYAHFVGLTEDGAAAGYGRVAAAMVEEITNALENPEVNRIGADLGVAVQAGRSLPEDELIRDSFSEDLLAEVDMVTHHRYAAQADGIDGMLRQFRPIHEAWQADVVSAGGDAPEINLGEWNVASLTRSEGLTRYIRDAASEGKTIDRDDVDLEGRTTTEFEQYWQKLIDTRDYGAAQPQLYLEMFSEYAAEGLGAASIHAVDLMHAGRISFTDADGESVRFVGSEMIDMLFESVEGTTVLEVSEDNRAASPMSTYAFENDDRLVVFLAADETATLGEVTVEIDGLSGGYAAIWTENLVAKVPQDWMDRFGIADNPDVDESNEGQTYAIGERGDVATRIDGDQLTVTMTSPGEVVRIVVARTAEEAAEIADWAGPPDIVADDAMVQDPDPEMAQDPVPVPGPAVPDDGQDAAQPGLSWADESLLDRLLPGRLVPAPVTATPPESSVVSDAPLASASSSDDSAPLWSRLFEVRLDPAGQKAVVLTKSASSEMASSRMQSDADTPDDQPLPAVPLDDTQTDDLPDSEDQGDEASGGSVHHELNAFLGALSSLSLGGFVVALAQHSF